MSFAAIAEQERGIALQEGWSPDVCMTGERLVNLSSSGSKGQD
jgi:hypothetical protein